MKYSEAKELLPNANYIYVGVTDKEVAKVAAVHYDTVLNDVRLFGTLEPVEALAKKELIAGSISFD